MCLEPGLVALFEVVRLGLLIIVFLISNFVRILVSFSVLISGFVVFDGLFCGADW